MATYNLNKEVTVITGGGQGLGLAQVKEFLKANSKVVIIDLNMSILKQVKEELNNDDLYIYEHNLKDFSNTAEVIAKIEKEVGNIDHLVNNAGVHLKKPVWDVPDDEWANIVDINITGTFTITREIVKKMKERKKGTIVVNSSMAGIMALPSAAGYVTTKTALIGFTRSVAVDCGDFNVRCNAVCPGFIDTAMTRKILAGDPERAKKINGRIPMPRLGTGEDIAQAILFLSDDQSSYITGQTLAIDGGYSVGF